MAPLSLIVPCGWVVDFSKDNTLGGRSVGLGVGGVVSVPVENIVMLGLAELGLLGELDIAKHAKILGISLYFTNIIHVIALQFVVMTS